MTGSTHAHHRSARRRRPTPEGHARDNPISGPRTGTTRSEPSAPASAEASGRHNEPGSRPASACPAQQPSKARGASPRGGKRHHSVWKGNQSTESDRPQPRHRDRCQATTAKGLPQTRAARTTRNKPWHRNRCQITPNPHTTNQREESRGTSEARTQAHTHPDTRARSGGPQLKPEH